MKNRIKKSLALLLVVIMLVVGLPMTNIAFDVSAEWENIFQYEVYFENAVITNCDKTIDGELVIPSVLGGYPVVKIDDYAFFECADLTSVTIPDSVTSIGDDVFRDCTSLITVTMPNSITSIGNYAFLGCTNLESVTIPNSITSIGRSTFSGCTELTNITIPDNVTSIGDHAFYKCISLTSVTIPDNVTDICWGAFRECTGLESLTIGSGVVNIEYFAFHDCKKLTSLVIPDSVKSISGEAFEDCVALKEITIGKNLKNVGYRAFFDCTELTKINWNAENANDFTIDKFGGECKAFLNAGNAEKGIEVVFGDNVKRIPAYAFLGCDNLRSATIPESVTEIGDRALGYYDDGYGKKVENFTIYGYYNTAAHTYAKTNGFKFVALDENHTHTFGEWTVTTSATCTSDGKETRTCSICEESETRTIAKTGHTDSNNDGKCDRCGAAIEGYNPSANCTCNCHKTGIAHFFFKIILFFQKLFKQNKLCKCGIAHY